MLILGFMVLVGLIAVFIFGFIAVGVAGMYLGLGFAAVLAFLMFLDWLLEPYGVLGDLAVIAFLIFAAVMFAKKIYQMAKAYTARVKQSVKKEHAKAVENFENKASNGK